MWGWPVNRYGCYGYNCKMRDEKAKAMGVPDPEEDLEQHLEALEKAKAKAEKKLKELKQKKQEEEEEEEESYYSCSASSSRSRSKSSKKSKAPRKRPATLEKVAEDNEAAALEKVVEKAEATLEKVVSVRRTRRAKMARQRSWLKSWWSRGVEGQPTKTPAVLGKGCQGGTSFGKGRCCQGQGGASFGKGRCCQAEASFGKGR